MKWPKVRSKTNYVVTNNTKLNPIQPNASNKKEQNSNKKEWQTQSSDNYLKDNQVIPTITRWQQAYALNISLKYF